MAAFRKSPREQALADVEKHGAAVGKWSAEKSAAERDLAELQDRAGEDLLADESVADRLAASMSRLRDRIDIAARAIAAAQPKLDAARRAAVVAEAAEWDAEAARRQRAVEQHEVRVAEAMRVLVELEGVPFAPRRVEAAADAEMRTTGPTTVMTPDGGRVDFVPRDRTAVHRAQSEELRREVWKAERTAWCLREIVAGRDPHQELARPLGPNARYLEGHAGFSEQPADFYTPSVWGPDAVLPAPAYVRSTPALEDATA